MTDQYRKDNAAGDLYRQLKLIGTHPDTGENIYAQVYALEAGSIGGGGAGSVVTVADPTTPTQKLAVDASGRITVLVSGTVPVSGTFWQTTQPVSIASMPSTPVTGTFWQNTQPVSGTFWQTTQPVSLASAPTTPVTGTFWQATQPVSLTTLPALVAGTAVIGHVIVDSAPSTAVTNAGTFAVQAALNAETTKVIGTINVAAGQTIAVTNAGTFAVQAALNAETTKVIGTVNIAAGQTIGVTGTFWQATQPVSIASMPSTPVTGTFWQATQPISGTVTVTPPTLTKDTQGATGFSVQDLKDAGRNTRIFMLDAFTAAPVAEAVQTVVQWYGNAAVAGTTQPAVVPAGKTLRLTSYKIMYQSLSTAGAAVVRIRANTGGLGVLASPLVASFEAGSVAVAAGVMTTETGTFEEGLELPAGTGLAFSMAGYGPTGTLTLEGTTRFMVYGYEY